MAIVLETGATILIGDVIDVVIIGEMHVFGTGGFKSVEDGNDG